VAETYTWPGSLSLTGATLTGTKRKKYETAVTAIDGTLTPDADQGANPGVFTWDYGAGDVGEPGEFFVQLRATFTDFDATIQSRWVVHGVQSASAVAAENVVGVPQGDADWLAAEKAATEAAADGNLLQGDGDHSEDSGIAAGDVLVDDDIGVSVAAQGHGHTAAAVDALPEDAQILSKSAGYELAAGDEGKIIECNGTFSITCPDGLDSGFQVVIVNVGSGTITVAAATTLQSKGSATQLTEQYAATVVYHRGSNVWLLFGDIA
jgi:hypothetical protein